MFFIVDTEVTHIHIVQPSSQVWVSLYFIIKSNLCQDDPIVSIQLENSWIKYNFEIWSLPIHDKKVNKVLFHFICQKLMAHFGISEWGSGSLCMEVLHLLVAFLALWPISMGFHHSYQC